MIEPPVVVDAGPLVALSIARALGLLVAAKRAGHITEVRSLLERMLAGGYYLSERLVARACQEAGEEPPRS